MNAPPVRQVSCRVYRSSMRAITRKARTLLSKLRVATGSSSSRRVAVNEHDACSTNSRPSDAADEGDAGASTDTPRSRGRAPRARSPRLSLLLRGRGDCAARRFPARARRAWARRRQRALALPLAFAGHTNATCSRWWIRIRAPPTRALRSCFCTTTSSPRRAGMDQISDASKENKRHSRKALALRKSQTAK